MLLQTNSYIVPKDKRTEHARLVKRFRQVMARLGCEDFEVYEQSGPNWSTEVGGRFVQIMRFRDRDHQRAISESERSDAGAQDLVREFCELVNFNYQQQQGLATTAYYTGLGSPPPAPADRQLGVSADVEMSSTDDYAEAVEAPKPINGSGVHPSEDEDRREAQRDDDVVIDMPPAQPFRPGPQRRPRAQTRNVDE